MIDSTISRVNKQNNRTKSGISIDHFFSFHNKIVVWKEVVLKWTIKKQ